VKAFADVVRFGYTRAWSTSGRNIMNTEYSTPVISHQAASELARARAFQAKSVWHRPALTYIDIKRTMNSGGSGVDCSAASSAIGPLAPNC
jgi:hypothetical protein